MKVFITGGTGMVGSACVPALVQAGHEVTALARSESSASKVKELGAKHVVMGTNTDLEIMRKAAAESEAVVHLAFDHNLAIYKDGMVQASAVDREAIRAMGDSLRPESYLITAADVLGGTGPFETDMKAHDDPAPRAATEKVTLDYVQKGIKAYSLRLAPIVHYDEGIHTFIVMHAAKAKEAGFVATLEGSTWPCTHANDVASLVAHVLEGKVPPGSAVHATAEEVPMVEVFGTMADKMGLPLRPMSPEDITEHLGEFLGWTVTSSIPISSELTRQWTGWQPKDIGIKEQIRRNYDFDQKHWAVNGGK